VTVQPHVAAARHVTCPEIASFLREHDNYLIVSHVRPDGDCLGSATGLLAALRHIGKRVAAYNVSGVEEKLQFIPNVEAVSRELPKWTPAVTLFVDCGGLGRVAPGFKPAGIVVNIDHHATNERFGDLNYIDITAAAVGEQIYYILREMGIGLTKEIATSLYVSIAADTGSFRFPNTSAQTFRIAADLADAGADPALVCRNLFESKSRAEMVLTGKVLNRALFECDGALCWSEIMWEDYAAVGGDEHEPDGVTTELRSIKGVEVAILFHELEGGGIRVGFRGKGLVDCAAIATHFGGGGHYNASGYYNDTVDYTEERNRILELSKRRTNEAMGR